MGHQVGEQESVLNETNAGAMALGCQVDALDIKQVSHLHLTHRRLGQVLIHLVSITVGIKVPSRDHG